MRALYAGIPRITGRMERECSFPALATSRSVERDVGPCHRRVASAQAMLGPGSFQWQSKSSIQLQRRLTPAGPELNVAESSKTW
jgi:hypothetical protein